MQVVGRSCKVCERKISVDVGVLHCRNCDSVYHAKCLQGQSESIGELVSKDAICPECGKPFDSVDGSMEQDEQHTRVPRKAWVAGILAFIFPGLGHVYNGRFLLGSMLFLAPIIFMMLVLSIAVASDTLVFVSYCIVFCVYVVVWIGQIVWAILLARKSGAEYQLKKYNKKLIYLCYAMALFLIYEGVSWTTKTFIVEAFSIPSGSMIPSLLQGDHIFVTKIGNRNNNPERGDLFVFKIPGYPPGEKYIMRVIAVAGDEISIKDGVIYLNGKPVKQKSVGEKIFWQHLSEDSWQAFSAEVLQETVGTKTYQIIHTQQDQHIPFNQTDYETTIIPEGYLFMMGDNRFNSRDSRNVGPIPISMCDGRAHSIWWSSGHDGLRSERIGQQL